MAQAYFTGVMLDLESRYDFTSLVDELVKMDELVDFGRIEENDGTFSVSMSLIREPYSPEILVDELLVLLSSLSNHSKKLFEQCQYKGVDFGYRGVSDELELMSRVVLPSSVVPKLATFDLSIAMSVYCRAGGEEPDEVEEYV